MNLKVLIYLNPHEHLKQISVRYAKQLLELMPKDWQCFIYSDELSIITQFPQKTHFINNDDGKYDVILNQQPQLTTYLKSQHPNSLIINYFHSVSCKESNKLYQLGSTQAEIDGMKQADLNLFPNNYAFALLDEARRESNLEWGEPVCGYFSYIPIIYGDRPYRLPKKKIILFNGKFSKSGWREVVKVCQNIRKTRKDFILWITDERIKQNTIFKKMNHSWIHVKAVKDEYYSYLIKHSHFAICNFKGFGLFDVTVLDTLYNGCFVSVPNNKLYTNMLGAEYPRFGDKDWIFGDMEYTINALLNNTREQNIDLIKKAEIIRDPSLESYVEQLMVSKNCQKS